MRAPNARRRGPSALTLLSFFLFICFALLPPMAAPADVDPVSQHLDSIRNEPDRLAAFVRAMPKGGDLHTHLSGAVSTETLVRFAVEGGWCVDRRVFQASPPPCGPDQRPASDTNDDKAFYDQVVAAWSMKGFASGPESGHDHFFATFGKFSPVTARHEGEILAEVASGAASQNEFYLEPLITLQFGAVAALAGEVGFDDDLDRMRAKLSENGAMDRIVVGARAEMDAMLAQFHSVLRCGTWEPDPACGLPIRFDHQVLRANPPEVVFAQLVLGFELMERDRRYVGVNLVQPEDDPTALRDYHLHMRMVDHLRDLYQRERVTLHAGELAPGLAPPPDLRFHIRDAVLTATAERIGHGVDIAGEDNAGELLGTMARRHVLVEIALTSNRQILGVSGDEHPFTLYRRSGVPVALVTDDEGVLRTDLSTQYAQAASGFDLSYRELKTLARAAIDHGFIQGASLWRAPDDFRPASACAGDRLGEDKPRRKRCRALLRSSPKAAAEWRQEAAFGRFERRYGN
jgi:adenosine deaminase